MSNQQWDPQDSACPMTGHSGHSIRECPRLRPKAVPEQDDFFDQVYAFGQSVMQDGELPDGWESLDLETVDKLNRFGELA